MLKTIKMVLIASLVGSIVACGGGDGNSSGGGGGGGGTPPGPGVTQTPAEKIAALESSGEIPKLERGPDISGPDSNTSGVRDDIESILTAEYTGAQLAAVLQTAKALQKALLVDTEDINAVKAVDRDISRGISCIFSKFNGAEGSKQPARVGQELESMTANTKDRLLAYLKYNKALDGTSSAWPEGDTCE
ncbi:hypothetical protein F3J24_05715 [Comamonas sp. Tr-654]|uniref:hypothetical protein n=1 Tax=Comamonas sp. Tr-654 TaxID=2608341 RepID=UPI001420BF34|nr:hypothetical protein [Comamonas sp. Tr-654]NIF82995.1 hypothetical protein [Comamonas sp. Tr-654]